MVVTLVLFLLERKRLPMVGVLVLLARLAHSSQVFFFFLLWARVISVEEVLSQPWLMLQKSHHNFIHPLCYQGTWALACKKSPTFALVRRADSRQVSLSNIFGTESIEYEMEPDKLYFRRFSRSLVFWCLAKWICEVARRRELYWKRGRLHYFDKFKGTTFCEHVE